MSWPFETVTATIANGASLSGAVDVGGVQLGGRVIVAIITPAAWTTAALTFQASDDGATFRNVYDEYGTEYTVQAAVDRHILIDAARFAGCRSLKVRSGTSGSAVNQGGDRSIGIVLREIT